MKPDIEQRARRIRAWDAAAATCAVMAMCVMTVSSMLYGLLPVILASAAFRFRVSAGRMIELALSVAALAAGWVLADYSGARYSGGVLAPVAAPLQLALLFLMVLRLFLAEPLGELRGTLVLGVLAFAAAGSASPGWGYPALAIVFLVTGLHGLNARQHARAAPGFPPLRELAPGAGYLLLASGVALALGAALPPFYAYTSERVVSWITLKPPRTGFTEGAMFLGSMEGMWESDAVVMRLQGEAYGAHLRGSVHRTYFLGRWNEEPSPGRVVQPESLQGEGGADQARVGVFRYDARPGPLFLPYGATLVGSFSADLQADAFGVLRSDSDTPPVRYAYRRSGGHPVEVLEPGPEDRIVPDELYGPLREIADRWVAGAHSRADQVLALVRELERGFVYSQHYERKPGRDPVLEFLQNDRQGHCEYFASALALLARSLDIPARVVRGYRVHERNPVLGHFVVRESAAHAWAEIHVDGAWRTYDPAPFRSAEPVPSETMSSLNALVDALRYFASEAGYRIKQGLGGLLEVGIIVAAVILAAFQVRAVLRNRRRRGAASDRATLAETGPLPCLEDLMGALAAEGIERRQGETLERLAARLPQFMPMERAQEFAAALHAYAALRYGGHGSGTEVGNVVRRLVAKT